ncbi:uncharacterized protein GGS22DRAFT_198849 [Annulohypoxylon maeteangense]|uniref:uncharacterized protein n=1 Tax=Annulohypoxylon maeteangense TaxID=1927788 RepID=UPI0020086E16|nr:uncharacterized protein GGS22DRAFT_198849 [Annulohypoxylon maeteangense]KAI0879810.1 hypothetical protein GGS22DRAFT_198849 [Annulohypoxylon maeteangense]
MRFQAPQLGALGVTFTGFRAMQFVSLVAIIGMTSNFINDIVTSNRDMPDVLVGTLSVASIATLYVSISYILYYDGLLPLLIAGGIDFALLVASIVVAVTIGKPLSMLKCQLLPQPAETTPTFTLSISTRDASAATKYNNYLALITTDQPHCYEIKAVWGLSIALCVLFAFSGVVCVGLWRRIKSSGADAPKDIEVEKPYRGDFGPARQISGPTALGTRLLSAKDPELGRWVPPPHLATPKPARRPPILRSVDEDIRPVPPTSVVVHANANAGPTIVTRQPPISNVPPPPAPAVLPLTAARSFDPSNEPKEDYIPIMHQKSLKNTDTNSKGKGKMPTLPIAVVIPPTPSDDGFTPITPTPASPRVKGFRLSRAPPLPQSPNALGISVPTGKSFIRAKSMKAEICHVDDETTPLSPTSGQDLQAQMVTMTRPKPKRKTLWGVIEGWWDLGLLERGKSLRRKG